MIRARVALFPGEIVDGKYRIVRLLGQGGMGAVYQGENVRIGKPVAIKVMHASLAREAELVARFEREAKAAARIGSSHIVDVLDLGDLPTRERYMVMEFLEGESLSARLKTQKRLPPPSAVAISIQLLEGLVRVHEAGILHRDLKPGNIFLARGANGSDFVKILDFGICKFVSGVKRVETTTDVGSLLGTPSYMAPEALEGSTGQLDARSDVYSAGVILYRCLAGKLPYPSSNLLELVNALREGAIPIRKALPGLDERLARIVDRATARRPNDRFGSAAELRDAMLTWAKSQDRVDQLLGEFLDVEPRERAAAIPPEPPRTAKPLQTPTEPTIPHDVLPTRKKKGAKIVKRVVDQDEVTAKRAPVVIPTEPMPMRPRAPSIPIDIDLEEDPVTLPKARHPNPKR